MKQHYLLESIVFVSGAVVMILELTGSRLLAPHVGGSLPVWTSLIGIILGSLSAGYMLGGKIADKNPNYQMLGVILFLSSIALCIIPPLSTLFLPLLLQFIHDIRISAVLASIILFVVPSIFLGMVSPYAIRLKLKSIQQTGETAGKLYAISTVGSIFGTFLAGFYLFSILSSTYIVYLLAAITFLLACLVSTKERIKLGSIFLILLTFSLTLTYFYFANMAKYAHLFETAYNSVEVFDVTDPKTHSPVREMKIGNKIHSGMYLNSPELLYEYTKMYHLSDQYNPKIQNALMIGGAGYSFPKDFIRRHPQGHMDVVEIDPGLTKLAEEYFSLKRSDRLVVYHEDARTFLNREKKRYDVIYNDAFASTNSLPFQLATKESIQHMYDLLTPNGIVFSDTISAITGEKGKIFRAQYYTYKSVFPYVYIFPSDDPEHGDNVQNTIIVAAKKPFAFKTNHPQWKKDVAKDTAIFTDNFAPIEQYALAFY